MTYFHDGCINIPCQNQMEDFSEKCLDSGAYCRSGLRKWSFEFLHPELITGHLERFKSELFTNLNIYHEGLVLLLLSY